MINNCTMNIALFSDTFPPQINGVAHVVAELAATLAHNGHTVTVVTVVNELKKRWPIEKQNTYTIIRVPSVPAMVYDGYRFALPSGRLLRYMKKNTPDIIHTHTPFSVGWEAVQTAKLFHTPLVGTHHTFYDHYLKYVKLNFDWTKKLAWKYVVSYYNRCTIVTSPSHALASALQEHGLSRPIQVLPNPISPLFFRATPNRKKKQQLKKTFGIVDRSIVYMGRVSYEKNINKVIHAFKQVTEIMPNTQLMIIGDGPDKERLKKLATSLGIQQKIVYTSFLYKQELVDALQANELFVTASESENMPLSVLEAMACGLPVVAVSALGIPEIVQHKKSGLLTKTDDPIKMADYIIELIKNPAQLKQFSQAAIEKSTEYTPGRMVASYEEQYKQLVKKDH